jgi:hypothetical protein
LTVVSTVNFVHAGYTGAFSTESSLSAKYAYDGRAEFVGSSYRYSRERFE